jgi:dienelactone hydrolase
MLRATVLAGLGALPLAGCSAVRNGVHALQGCVDAPRQSDHGIRYFSRTLQSRHVRGPVAYEIAMAADQDPRMIENVVYVLPGRSGLARDVFAVLNYGGPFAAMLRSRPQRRDTILVSVDSGETYFHPRRNGEDRLAMLTDELPHALASFIGWRPEREALIGQSMGGYGALLAAAQNPSRYEAIAVAGPAIFPSYEDERRSVGDAFDSPADFARHDVVSRAPKLIVVRVLVKIGEHDPFLPGVRAFAEQWSTANVTVEPGCHDDGFWRASAPSLLEYVFSYL